LAGFGGILKMPGVAVSVAGPANSKIFELFKDFFHI
jgi:hypothetical protein